MRFSFSHLLLIMMGVLFAVGASAPSIVGHYKNIPEYTQYFKLDLKEWIAMYAVLFAVFGWVLAAWVQVRNSIKQHTVNTMLQSRLSTAFTEHGKRIQATYSTILGNNVVLKEHLTDPDKKDALESYAYMLNYYEFIAIGIYKNDFEESLLKKSLRTIVITLVHNTAVLLDHSRGVKDDGTIERPRVYNSLLWLYDRWKN